MKNIVRSTIILFLLLTVPLSSTIGLLFWMEPPVTNALDQAQADESPMTNNIALEDGNHLTHQNINTFSSNQLVNNDDDIELVSKNYAGNATANDVSGFGYPSSDGQYIVFASLATDLVSDVDTGGFSQVYLQDNGVPETLTLVSLGNSGQPSMADRGTGVNPISDDGCRIVYSSADETLVENDTNAQTDVFLRDMCADPPITILVSVSTDFGAGGLQGDKNSSNASISDDGRFVVFESRSSTLDDSIPVDGVLSQLYLRDLDNNITTLISHSPAFSAGNGHSMEPVISGNGKFISFTSSASNLVTDDQNEVSDIFLYKVDSEDIERISISTEYDEANRGSSRSYVSADGEFITFNTLASDLGGNVDFGGPRNIYLRDRTTGTTNLISEGFNDELSNGDSVFSSVSEDGTLIVFSSRASNLVESDSNEVEDVFLYNRNDQTITLLSNGINSESNGESSGSYISDDGSLVAFRSESSNLTSFSDTNNSDDVFTTNIDSSVVRMTITPSSIPADGSSSGHVTLHNAPPGHLIRFISSRGSIDNIGVFTGFVDSSGQITAEIRSSIPGVSVITAEDLTENKMFATSVQAGFFSTNEPPNIPPNLAEVKILDVSSTYDLSALYPIGLIPLINQIVITVDWGEEDPGSIEYRFNNDLPFIQQINSNQAEIAFNFDEILNEGTNTLEIKAISADGIQSPPEVFSIIGWTSDWLQTLLGDDVDINLNDFTVAIKIPGQNLLVDEHSPWLPDKGTSLSPRAYGSLTIPYTGNEYEASIGVGVKSSSNETFIFKEQEFAALQVLGISGVEAEFSGTFKGDLIPEFPWLEQPETYIISASGKASYEIRESVIVAIQPLPPAGPIIVEGLKSVDQVDEWLKRRASFYIKVTPELGGTVTFNWGNDDLEPIATTIFTEIELEAGVEIDVYVAEGKIYAILGSRIDWVAIPEFDINKWKFYGIGGYELKSGYFIAKEETIIDWTPIDQQLNSPDFQSLVTDNEPDWELISRTYLNSEFVTFESFNENLEQQQLANQSISSLSEPFVSNVFPYPEPFLSVNPQGSALLIWNSDDPVQSLGQGYDLSFSFWDGNEWSTPSKATDDTFPDASPQVEWLSNDTALAVWERLDDPALPVSATLNLTQTRKMEIAWATYDVTTNEWSMPDWLTQNSIESNLVPILSKASDDSIWVAWRNNPVGQLGGDETNTDRIQVAQWLGNDWSLEQTVADNIPGIVDLAISHEGSIASVVWTASITPSGSLTPTLQLFVSQFDGLNWSSPTQLTDDSIDHTKPQIIYRQGEPFIVWLAGDTLTLQNLNELQTNGFSPSNVNFSDDSVELPTNIQIDQFRLFQDVNQNIYALFSGTEGSQRDLFLTYYDAALALWGLPQPLTNDEHSESYPTVSIDDSGELLISYSLTEIVDEERTATDPGTGEVVTFTIPVDGQTDLHLMSHSLRQDIALNQIQLADQYPEPSDTTMISAVIENVGDIPLVNFTVDFSDNDGVFNSLEVEEPLAAGQIITITSAYTVPTTGGVQTITITTDAENILAEIDETNNSSQVQAYGPDLAIIDAASENWGGNNVGLITIIQNFGTTASPPSEIDFYWESITGTLVVTNSVPSLAAGEVLTMTTPWTFSELAVGSYEIVSIVNQDSNQFLELNLENNIDPFSLNVQADLAVNPLYTWSQLQPDGSVVVSTMVFNFGSIASTSSEVDFYANDLFTDTAHIDTILLPAIPPASFEIISTTWTSPSIGNHQFYAVVNPNRSLTETTWENNATSVYGISTVANLEAEKVDFDLLLTWSYLHGTIDSYNVYRSPFPYFEIDDPDVELVGLNLVPSPEGEATFLDTGIINSETAYYYMVEPIVNGESAPISNQVGVIPIVISPNWNLLSLPLIPIDSSLDAVLGTQLFGTEDPQTADRILIWNTDTQSYDSAWFCGGPVCETFGEPFYNHWLANDYSQSSLTIKPDTGFWLQNRSGVTETLVIVGQVANLNRDVPIQSGYQLLGSAFPTSKPLDEANLPATGTEDPQTGDRILYWDAVNQTYESAWFCGGPVCETFGEPFYNHWLANDYSATTIVIESGHGFWYQNRHDPLVWENLLPIP